VPLTGLSDHFVSEALILDDPGIEIYWDRPREFWEGQVASRMTTLPLDVDDLLSAVPGSRTDSFDGLPAGTVMGHVHLKVSAIPDPIAFYRDVLGFDLMARLGARAAFFAAGGSHHHIGANTWQSAGAAAPPHADLRCVTIVVPDVGEREAMLSRIRDYGLAWRDTGGGPAVTDPSGISLVLAVGDQARGLSADSARPGTGGSTGRSQQGTVDA
jgi:catechol 2,3-dioxygenase